MYFNLYFSLSNLIFISLELKLICVGPTIWGIALNSDANGTYHLKIARRIICLCNYTRFPNKQHCTLIENKLSTNLVSK
jgi:hypothetical protein